MGSLREMALQVGCRQGRPRRKIIRPGVGVVVRELGAGGLPSLRWQTTNDCGQTAGRRSHHRYWWWWGVHFMYLPYRAALRMLSSIDRQTDAQGRRGRRRRGYSLDIVWIECTYIARISRRLFSPSRRQNTANQWHAAHNSRPPLHSPPLPCTTASRTRPVCRFAHTRRHTSRGNTRNGNGVAARCAAPHR